MALNEEDRVSSLALCDAFCQIGLRNGISPDVAREVTLILEMWSFIKASYDVLSDDAQKRVRTATAGFVFLNEELCFPGFDVDTEKDHHAATEIFVNRLDLFPLLRCKNLGGFAPSLTGYRTMLGDFAEMRRGPSRDPLSEKEIASLLCLFVLEEEGSDAQAVSLGR